MFSTAVLMQTASFWDAPPCRSVDITNCESLSRDQVYRKGTQCADLIRIHHWVLSLFRR
jgi:hypothetical protein